MITHVSAADQDNSTIATTIENTDTQDISMISTVDNDDNINSDNINTKNLIKGEVTQNKEESSTSTVTSEKNDTFININPIDDVKINDNVTVSGNLINHENNNLKNVNLRLTINGETTTIKTDTTGTYTYTTTATTLGTNNVTIKYTGNSKYNPSSATTTFTVNKKDAVITINMPQNIGINDSVTITGKLKNTENTNLKNASLKITINDETTTIKTDTTGTYTYTTTATTLGTNNVTIKYTGNSKYNPTNLTTTFIVKKDAVITINPINITSSGNEVTITGTLKNTENNPLKNVNLKIKINDETTTIKTDSKGTYTYTTTSDIVGINNVTVRYAGNSKYNPTNATATFDMPKLDPDIRLSPSEIHPNTLKRFLILLPSDATGTVILKIDDEQISDDIEVVYGQIIYSYVIPSTYDSEYYTLYVTYSGDEKYAPKTVNTTLTLTPAGGKVDPTMNIDNITSKYLSTIDLKVQLDDDAKGNVTFKINDTEIALAYVEDGIATYEYENDLIPGVYTLYATYNGNYKYRQTTVNSTITIEKLETTLVLKNEKNKAGNTTAFTANLVDELGRISENVQVQFWINDTLIGSNTTNKNGTATLYYQIPSSFYSKKYNLTAKSAQTDTLLSSTGKATLSLKQLKTTVAVPNISTIPSKTVTITATVLDEFNNYVTKGNVTFKKGNKTLETIEVSSGFAKFVYETNYETTELDYIYASYVGDWKYASSEGNGTFKVTKLKTTISLSSVDAKPNSEILLSATIRDENLNPAEDGVVIFLINNTEVGKANVKNGVATFRTTLNNHPSGTFRMNSIYNGSKIYKNSTSTNTLTVTRYSTTIKGDPINAVVGQSTSISVSVIDNEKYNVNNGTVKFYVNNTYIGSSNVTNGISTISYTPPSAFDGKIIKYYAAYVQNDVYDSSSYTNTITVSHQKTVYVSINGSDSNLGDEEHPFRTIAHAVNHITLFGTIMIGEGTFGASGITLNNSINIIGSGMDKTIITGYSSGNTMFNISKRNVLVTISSVTIKNAVSNSEFSGGAIVNSGKLNIIDSKFTNNVANGNFSGGAIYNNGVLNVTNTEFTNNAVTNPNSQGGAIRIYNNITYITNCKFDSNKVNGTESTGGSAIYSDDSEIVITNTTFTKNRATGNYITGGVIRSIYGVTAIINSTFDSNTAKGTDYAVGGVIGSIGCGISIVNSTFTSNNIEGTNTAGGGVIYVETAVLDISNTTFASNKLTSTTVYGGVLYSYYGYTTISDSILDKNKVISTNNGFGGTIYNNGNLTVSRTNFTENSVKSDEIALAGAIYSVANLTISDSNFIKNSVNASNLGGGAMANMGYLTVTQTNFINNTAYNSGNAITATATSINEIENNYWGSSSPEWTKLLYSVTTPTTFSTTPF